MKKNAQLLTDAVLTVVGVLVGLVVFARRSEQRESAALVYPQHVERERSTEDSTSQRAKRLFARWEAEYTEQNLYTKTPIPMDFSRAFSARFTKARGQAEINFQSGQISVSVANLDPLPEGASYEFWLVDQVAGEHNSAALDLGEDGDQI